MLQEIDFHFCFLVEITLIIVIRQQVIELTAIGESSISTSRVENIGHYQSGDPLLKKIHKSGKGWNMGVPTNSQ